MDKKVKYRIGTVLLSGLIIKGMFAIQPNVILTTGEALEEEMPLCALDQDGNYVDVSELVQKMITDGTVYLDRGYLYSRITGMQIHPITGDEMEPVQDEGSIVPGETEGGGEGAIPGGTEGDGEVTIPGETEGDGEVTEPGETEGDGEVTIPGGTEGGGEVAIPGGTEGDGEVTEPGGTEGDGEVTEPGGTEGDGEGAIPGGTEGDGEVTEPGGTEEGGEGAVSDGTGESMNPSDGASDEGAGTESSGSDEEEDEADSSDDEEGDETDSANKEEDDKDSSDSTEKKDDKDSSDSTEKKDDKDSSDDDMEDEESKDAEGTDSSEHKGKEDESDFSGHKGKGDGTSSGRPKGDKVTDTSGSKDSSSSKEEEEETKEEEEERVYVPNNGMNEDEAEARDDDRPYKSNAELIANQRIVEPPKIVKDFRFWTVARKYAFAKENICIRESIPENLPVSFPAQEYIQDVNLQKVESEVQRLQSAEGVREAGVIEKDGLLYILKQEDNGWLYVESGSVRGFVNSAEVYTGKEADGMLKKYQEKAKKAAKQMDTDYTGIEDTAPVAEELIPAQENEAFTYLRATVNQTVINKEYAVAASGPAAVKEGQDGNSRTVGTIPENGLCYIVADKDKEWIYVESGDVRGFVKNTSIRYGNDVKEEVLSRGEEHFSTADAQVKPEENAACYYTLTSVKSGIPNGEIRNSIIEFASQFVGNPYVWGGTSLTNGADCSGFVQSIYRMYGYHLPRVADAQSQYGTQIPVECAEPGDLIFYAEDGYVYHVVMYAGDGKTIEAMSADAGIVWSEVDTSAAVWATRILEDTQYGYIESDISEVNASEDMYGECLGSYKLTYYCACEICCDVETGITATGAPVVEGRTIAVDPSVIPYGTQVIINGHVFTAEDCGGAIKGNRIDIYVNDHATALALGVGYSDVYLVK